MHDLNPAAQAREASLEFCLDLASDRIEQTTSIVLVSTDDAIADGLSALASSVGLRILRRGSLFCLSQTLVETRPVACLIHVSDWHQNKFMLPSEAILSSVPLVFVSSDIRSLAGARAIRNLSADCFELPHQQQELVDRLSHWA